MSRTKRNIRKGYNPQYITTGGDAQVDHGYWGHRKMRPYTKSPTDSKFEPELSMTGDGYMKRVSSTEKLRTRNANRSMKKGIRQEHKKEILNQLYQ